MKYASEDSHSSEFIDLLLEQFAGEVGEIALATNYLAQATSDHNPKRRRILTSIAKRKMRHADILGTILISISDDKHANLKEVDRERVAKALEDNEVSSTHYKSLFAIFTSLTQLPDRVRKFSTNPKEYLTANIQAEDQQIFTYERLISLTHNPHFITALKIAQKQQILHKNELLALLSNIER